jgi:hypothetical protein
LEQKLIGFDPREMWIDYRSQWPERFRRISLLKQDVEKPLSVDIRIWPSVFDDVLEPPSWTGGLNTWDDLDRLESFLRQERARDLSFWVIAISVVLDGLSESERELWRTGPPRIPTIKPDMIDSSWSFLGFDVGDQWLISGLTNCQYNEQTMPTNQSKYQRLLNQYHLFNELEAADRFRRDTNLRVPEHAPFAVFGIYSVEKHTGGKLP